MTKKYYNLILIFSLQCLLPACQLGHLAKSAYYQSQLLIQREPIEEVLKTNNNLSHPEQQKLKLALEVADFSWQKLGLKKNKNYRKYVQLDQPYVIYTLNAANKDALKNYEWNYPLVGKMPYIGFFKLEDGKTAEQKMIDQGFDTYLRGVSAYSTLGWFDDPILSSMLNYSDYDLVNTIIHENTHTTLFIKSNADFNERLASFVGNIGAELYYHEKEGTNSVTLQNARHETKDEKVFSQFITEEIKKMDNWYLDFSKENSHLSTEEKNIKINNLRELEFLKIQKRFNEEIRPLLITKKFDYFSKVKLNNARLGLYKTYMMDLSDFEKAYQKLGSHLPKFLEFCITLEKEKNPEQALKDFIKI